MAKTSFANSQDFSKICPRVKVWSMVLRPGRKPHWPFSNFLGIFFQGTWHTPFLEGYKVIFLDNSYSLGDCLSCIWEWSHLPASLYWCFSKVPLHTTHACQPTYFFFVQCLQHFRSDFVFNSSFSGFQSSYTIAATSVNVKTCSLPKSIVSHESVGNVLTGFNKSSKHSLQRERISFSSRKMYLS